MEFFLPQPDHTSSDLAVVATGRTASLFTGDVEARSSLLRERLGGRRILVVGGAGSIGSSTLRQVLAFRPAAVHVVDANENALAELTRDLRSQNVLPLPKDLRFLPIDFGGTSMQRLLRAEPSYNLVLHFAAHKHVRSEKDVPSLLQMIDTNVVKLSRLLRWLDRYGHRARCFAVSTDKAANPTSFMGASKRLMEHVLFSAAAQLPAASARFANVAFSNGSLPQALLYRMALRQPLAVPAEVRRYFVSMREAGEICLLAAVAAPERRILFPNLDPQENLRSLVAIAEALLRKFGLEAQFYDDVDAAIGAVAGDMARGRYPVVVTPLDTSGEKPYEEFVGKGEVAEDAGFSALSAIAYRDAPPALPELLAFLDQAIRDAEFEVGKDDVAARLARCVDGFAHVEAGRSLDERA